MQNSLDGSPHKNGGHGSNAGVNIQKPRKSGVPSDTQAPMNGESFRGNQPGGTGANDRRKAK